MIEIILLKLYDNFPVIGGATASVVKGMEGVAQGNPYIETAINAAIFALVGGCVGAALKFAIDGIVKLIKKLKKKE